MQYASLKWSFVFRKFGSFTFPSQALVFEMTLNSHDPARLTYRAYCVSFSSQSLVDLHKGTHRLQRLLEGSGKNRWDDRQRWLAPHRRYWRMASGKFKLQRRVSETYLKWWLLKHFFLFQNGTLKVVDRVKHIFKLAQVFSFLRRSQHL